MMTTGRKLTGEEAGYLGKVAKVISGLEAALDTARELRDESPIDTREERETGKLVDDLEDWLRWALEYRKLARENPGKYMFQG